MSAEYLSLMRGRQDAIMQRYFECARECESVAARDHSAAVAIQRRWRGHRDRQYLSHLHSQALAIQRTYRGHRGRLRFGEELSARDHAAHASFFGGMATRIQALVRGHLSRRHTADLYARRSYIAEVAQTGEALVSASEAALEAQLIAQASAASEARSKRFESRAQNSHHLLGTRAIPSVFHSTRGPEFCATAFDIPMEEHLKEAFVNRQTQMRKMRQQTAFQPAPPPAVQGFVSTPLPVAAAGAAVPSVRVDSSLSASDMQQQPFQPQRPGVASLAHSAVPSARGSSAGSRASRPSSGGRLAPLQQAPAQPTMPSAVPAPAPAFTYTQQRGFASSPSVTSLSGASSASSLHAYGARSAASLAARPAALASPTAAATQKLPALRPTPTPSGRTLDAQQLYDSKIGSSSLGVRDEEKTPVPLAFGLGGHVSTTPTSMAARQQQHHAHSLAATRTFAPAGASPDKRKWSQPVKPAASPQQLRAAM